MPLFTSIRTHNLLHVHYYQVGDQASVEVEGVEEQMQHTYTSSEHFHLEEGGAMLAGARKFSLPQASMVCIVLRASATLATLLP